MTSIKLTVSAKIPAVKADTIIINGLSTVAKSIKAIGSPASVEKLAGLNFKLLGANAKSESVLRVNVGQSVVGLVGVGSAISSDQHAREIGGAIGRAFSDSKSIVVDLALTSESQTIALLEGIALVQYSFDKYKSNPAEKRALASATVISPFAVPPKALERIAVLSQAIDNVRDLINTPANDLTPQLLAEQIKAQAKIPGVVVEIWDEKRLAKENCVGILSVGKGSIHPPRLIKITYTPKVSKAHLALVGKGITFDTGGLNLKPIAGMLGMKYDMAGSATVGVAALAIAKLGLPIKVTAFMCVAENMVSGAALKPTDVIKLRNGKTVEVTNPDAEGRLVLADGLILASDLKPDLIVDVATLTGGARIALGNRYAGLMGTGNGTQALLDAANDTSELVWAMPLPEELLDLIKSDVADMMNSRIGNPSGSMLVGGLFLREFVGRNSTASDEYLNWAHVDFATSANNDLAPYGHTLKGATGAMVRTLVRVAERLAGK